VMNYCHGLGFLDRKPAQYTQVQNQTPTAT